MKVAVLFATFQQCFVKFEIRREILSPQAWEFEQELFGDALCPQEAFLALLASTTAAAGWNI